MTLILKTVNIKTLIVGDWLSRKRCLYSNIYWHRQLQRPQLIQKQYLVVQQRYKNLLQSQQLIQQQRHNQDGKALALREIALV